MTKYFIFFVLILSTINSVFTQVDLSNGLIVHYPFDGNANDISGNEHHGTVMGATLIEDRFGNPNSAYSFDGHNDFIDLPDTDLLHLDFPLSLSLWARADENAASYDAGVFDSDYVENNYHGIFASLNTFHGSLGASFGDGSGTTSINSRRTVNYITPIETEIYHHMVVVFKSSTSMELYFNNELVSTTVTGNGGDEIGYSMEGGVIGKTDNSTSEPNINFFQGEIDDLRMYNRALSIEDIEALYKPDLNDGLIVNYPFDGNANDVSGNEHNGTVMGATLVEDRFGCPNSAYSFDGDNDFIDLPDTDLLHLDFPLSLSLWARADENAASFDNGLFDSDFVEDNYHGIFAGLNTFRGSVIASFGDGGGTTGIDSRRTVTYSTPIETEIYHHIVVVYKSSTSMELYFNNQLVSTTVTGSGGNEIAYSVEGGVIGKTDNSTSVPNIDFFQGEIDDLRMYSRALSAVDVNELYTASPIFVTPPSEIADIGCSEAFPAQELLMATHACSSVNISMDTLDYEINLCTGYEVTYRWIAVDTFNNADTVLATFNVLPDTIAPMFVTPPSAIADIGCSAPLPPQEVLMATDDCSIVTVSMDTLEYGVNLCTGYEVTYRWIAVDTCNNADTVLATFNILPDTIVPMFVTPPSAIADIGCSALFPAQEVLMAADDCSTVTVSMDTLVYEVNLCTGYEVTYRWIAVDTCNNADTVLATFNVLPDSIAPMFVTPPSAIADIGCSALFPAQEVLMATDDCSTVTVSMDTLDYEVNLCTGYEVTYRWIAVDTCNNADTVLATFNILPDSIAPMFVTPPSAIADIGCSAPFPAQEVLMATDDCSTVTISMDTLDYEVNLCTGYEVTYRWIAVDTCNNADTVLATFNILPDSIAPMFVTPPSAIADIGCSAPFPAQEVLMATDDCSTVTISMDTLDFEINLCTGYEIAYRWIAVDTCNNADTVLATFNVLPDTIAPMFVTPPSEIADIEWNATFPTQEVLMATDDCSTVTISMDTLDFEVNQCAGYEVSYRWIAEDTCNNADTVLATFNVLPDTETRVVSDTISENTTIQVNSTLQISSTVEAPFELITTAGTSICIESLFEVQNGAVFEASIEDCNE